MLSRHTIQLKTRRPKTPELRTGCRVTRILVPLDFSAASNHALHHATALARDVGANLILLHIVEPIVCQADFGYGCVTTRSPNQHDLKASQARLSSICKRLAAPGTARPLAVVRTGVPVAEIVRAAIDLAADLIVIGTRGHTLPRTSGSSTAETLVRNAPCPVLVVHRKQLQPVHLRKERCPNETRVIARIDK